MAIGYLVLASARRVLVVEFDSKDHYSIERTIGTETVEHGTTFWSEDQFLVDAEPSDGTTAHYRVQGVPFRFCGNGLLIGTDPISGDTADRPTMELEEFRRLVSFTRWSQPRLAHTVPHVRCDD